MSMLLAVLAPLLAQVGPFTPPGEKPLSPLPPELQDRHRTTTEAPVQTPPPLPPVPVSPKLADCLASVRADPTEAVPGAEAWLDKATGDERADAGQCLGVALSRLERWDDAHTAFLVAHDALEPTEHARRARLGALAGNAALAHGDAGAALAVLDSAHADAESAGEPGLAGDISIDRARALVALGREKEASAALDEARKALPGDAEAWLLSATLSRRMGNLAEAQQQIEKAADLRPIDPEIGLEAGRIAILAGHPEAARKSWQSVVNAAPDSDAGKTAKGYLAQLDADEGTPRSTGQGTARP